MRSLRTWVRQRKDRPNRPWYCQWEYITTDGGIGRETKTCGPGKEGRRDAERKEAEMKAWQASLGMIAPKHDPRITVAEFGRHWLTVCGPGLKPKTRTGYAEMLERHLKPLHGTSMRDVTPPTASALLGALVERYAVGTVRHAYAAGRRMFERARFEGVVQSNPFRGVWVELPIKAKEKVVGRRREKDDVKAMSADQLKAFLRGARAVGTPEGRCVWMPFHRDYVLFLLMARTGVRLGEALALQLDDLDLEHADMAVRRTLCAPKKGRALKERLGETKTSRERIVELGPEVVEALRRHLARRLEENLKRGQDATPWLFATPGPGTPLSEFNVRRSFRRVLERAKLSKHFTPHCLRHTFATLMLAAGASLLWVAKQLGHADPQTTLDWYSWALPSADRSYAALLDAPVDERATDESKGGQS